MDDTTLSLRCVPNATTTVSSSPSISLCRRTLIMRTLPTAIFCVSYPTNENTSESPSFAEISYTPFSSVEVPRVVPMIATFTPTIGVLSTSSVTVPVISCCWTVASAVEISRCDARKDGVAIRIGRGLMTMVSFSITHSAGLPSKSRFIASLRSHHEYWHPHEYLRDPFHSEKRHIRFVFECCAWLAPTTYSWHSMSLAVQRSRLSPW